MAEDMSYGSIGIFTYICMYLRTYVRTVEHSYNKPEISGQSVCYKEFFISGEFSMRYCNTWLRSLFCYIKNFDIEEFVIRVLHCMYVYGVH